MMVLGSVGKSTDCAHLIGLWSSEFNADWNYDNGDDDARDEDLCNWLFRKYVPFLRYLWCIHSKVEFENTCLILPH